MPSTIISDDFCQHRKSWAAGPACWILPFMLSYSGRHLTDGHLSIEEMRRAVPPDWESAAERLVACGLLDKTETGYQIHDYLDVNASRDEILRRRGKTLTRVRRFRNAVTDEERAGIDERARQLQASPARKKSKLPSVTTPSMFDETAGSSDTVDGNGASSTSKAQENGVTRPDPNRSEPIRTEEEKSENKTLAKKPRSCPAVDALNIVAEHSGGRFSRIEEVTGPHAIHFNRTLIKIPKDAWKLIGEWLAAGGEGYLGTLTYPKVMGNAIAWREAAKGWEREGRGPVAQRFNTTAQFPGQTARKAAVRAGTPEQHTGAIEWLSGPPQESKK